MKVTEGCSNATQRETSANHVHKPHGEPIQATGKADRSAGGEATGKVQSQRGDQTDRFVKTSEESKLCRIVGGGR